jgi:hypothetical protein
MPTRRPTVIAVSARIAGNDRSSRRPDRQPGARVFDQRLQRQEQHNRWYFGATS